MDKYLHSAAFPGEEAADDIAYKTADIEDAFVKGFLSYYKILEELKNKYSFLVNSARRAWKRPVQL